MQALAPITVGELDDNPAEWAMGILSDIAFQGKNEDMAANYKKSQLAADHDAGGEGMQRFLQSHVHIGRCDVFKFIICRGIAADV